MRDSSVNRPPNASICVLLAAWLSSGCARSHIETHPEAEPCQEMYSECTQLWQASEGSEEIATILSYGPVEQGIHVVLKSGAVLLATLLGVERVCELNASIVSMRVSDNGSLVALTTERTVEVIDPRTCIRTLIGQVDANATAANFCGGTTLIWGTPSGPAMQVLGSDVTRVSDPRFDAVHQVSIIPIVPRAYTSARCGVCDSSLCAWQDGATLRVGSPQEAGYGDMQICRGPGSLCGEELGSVRISERCGVTWGRYSLSRSCLTECGATGTL